MPRDASPRAIHLKDYQPPAFLVDRYREWEGLWKPPRRASP